MRHIQITSRALDKAQSIGIGTYLVVAGQILAIVAAMFMSKEITEEAEDTTKSR